MKLGMINPKHKPYRPERPPVVFSGQLRRRQGKTAPKHAKSYIILISKSRGTRIHHSNSFIMHKIGESKRLSLDLKVSDLDFRQHTHPFSIINTSTWSVNIKQHHTQLKINSNYDEFSDLPELGELKIHQEKAPTRADPLGNHSICKINANRGFKPCKFGDSNATSSELKRPNPCSKLQIMVDLCSMEWVELIGERILWKALEIREIRREEVL